MTLSVVALNVAIKSIVLIVEASKKDLFGPKK